MRPMFVYCSTENKLQKQLRLVFSHSVFLCPFLRLKSGTRSSGRCSLQPSASNSEWGQEKGERNASLLMVAPGSEEGRDRERGRGREHQREREGEGGGFNEGNGKGREAGSDGGERERGGGGGVEADSLAPQLFGKTHRLLWKTQDVGMQAGKERA